MRTRLGLSRSQLVIGLLLATVLVGMAVLQSQPQSVEFYDPDDASSTGLRALVLWLEEMEYPVTIEGPRTSLPDGAGLLLIHPSNQSDPDYYADTEAAAIYEWVEDGGTLVLVGPTIPYTPLSERFGVVQSETLSGIGSDVRQLQPLLPDVEANWSSFFATRILNFYDGRTVVPILGLGNGDPMVAIQLIGDGVVWHLSEDFALTNLNLRDERVASLLSAILRTVPAGAPVLFSTHHLASFDPADGDIGEVNTLQDWLYTTPFGQGTLLVMVVLFVYFLLQGRRLGPPLPGPTANRPREAAEYVTALAGLQRRMRKPDVVADHYRQRLKSAVGRLTQVPADLTDAEWLAQLRRSEVLSPTLLAEVTDLLSGYAKVDSKTSDEGDLIHLVRATDALLASLPRANKQLVR
jgi:hypothetical protein